jgi:flavorubredoxin
MAIWIREILRELNIDDLRPINLLQDNKSSLIMVCDPSTFKRSKHMLTQINYLRDLKKMGIIIATHLGTDEMTSDLLTKALQGTIFIKHRDNLQGLQWTKYIKPT